MAFLRPHPSCQERDCHKPSTHELFNNFNAPMGVYCASHGVKAEEAQQAREDAQ